MGDKFHDFRRNHVGRVQLKLASKSLPLGLPDAVCSPVIRRLKPAAIHCRPLRGQLNTPYSSAYVRYPCPNANFFLIAFTGCCAPKVCSRTSSRRRWSDSLLATGYAGAPRRA